MKADIGMLLLQAKKHQRLPTGHQNLGEGHATDTSSALRGTCLPTPGSQPPVLWDSTSPWSQPHRQWCLVMAAERHDYIIQEPWLTYSPPSCPREKTPTHIHSNLSHPCSEWAFNSTTWPPGFQRGRPHPCPKHSLIVSLLCR